VRLENETVWLTQLKIAELFGVQKAAISKHIKHICDNVAIYQFPISSRGGCMTSEKQIAVQNVSPEKIQSRILVIRGAQIMLDRDLAELYGVSVKRLNEQVRRNIERFPSGFMFQLSASEFADLKSQIATSSSDGKLAHLKSQIATSSWGGIRKAPKVFTEQGVAMLSAVLNSPTAILVSIAIMEAFVRMRHFMMDNAEVVCRMNVLEKKQMSTDAKVDDILKRLDSTERPSQGVFYDGQLWDARALVLKLIGSAKRSIILIDNWATTETLDIFTKKRKGVKLTIFTSEHYDKKHVPHHKISDADIATFNAQYPHFAVRYNESFHDRFLIVDDKELYLIGASLKDLGRKCFGFTKMDAGEIERIKKVAFGVTVKS
jgi:phage regulator Rha-like protein